MTIKAVVEYDGKGFHGFQMQKNEKLRTVQRVLEEVLSSVLNESIKISYAGRTDKGVNAARQVISFDTNSKMLPGKFKEVLNRLLADDVKIVELTKEKEGFDARRNIKSKTYGYNIWNGAYVPPLKRHYFLHVPQLLNIEKMKEAAEVLTGTHDFTSFCSTECEKENKVRTIFDIFIKKTDEHVHIMISGSGFLQHMVRIICGTLIMVGKGQLAADDVRVILERKDRKHKGKTEKPHALTLVKIEYGE